MNRLFLGLAATVALAGPGCAQVAPSPPATPDRAQTSPNKSPATGNAQASEAPLYVEGPDGRQLIGFNDPPPGGELKFKQIAGHVTKGEVLGSDETFLISRLPATFIATIGDEICTATLIGPKVLLTAAHCLDAKEEKEGVWQTLTGSVALADGSGGQDIHSCMMAPAYTAAKPKKRTVRNENDYALCELFLPINIRAEPIALEPNRIIAGQPLLIAGYGCTEQDLSGNQIVANNPTSGTLHVGTNLVRGGGPDGWIQLKGRIGSKDAILCPGDSGSAAFANASIVLKDSDFGWRVVAVSSSVGPTGNQGDGEYLSFLAPLADPDFKVLLDAWVAKRPSERKICGPDSVALGTKCRR